MKRFPRRTLLLPAVAVAVAWFLLWLHPARHDDPVYGWIALEIGIVGAIGVYFQLRRTTSWTIRAMGVLAYVLGGAILYLTIAQGHWYPLSPGWHEGWTDLAAAVLFVGGPLLLYGYIATTVDDRRAKNDPDMGRDSTPLGLP